MSFMDNGGSVYIEGADVASHVANTDFIEYFGAVATSSGTQAAIMDIYGVDGTFTANNAFDYPYGTDTDYNIDELAATTGTEFLTCQADVPRAVYYNSGTHRSIISAPVIGGFKDGEGSNTKSSLMIRYFNFLMGIEASDIFVADTEIDFGIQYVDFPFDYNVNIQNFGLSDLEVTGVAVSGFGFSSTVTGPFTLEIGESFSLPVNFESSVSGTFTGTLTISSNDPDECELVIPLYVECLLPPVCQLPSTTIEASAEPDGVVDMAFTINNAGDSDLSFCLDVDEIEEAVTQNTPIYGDIELAKGEVDWRDGYISTRGAGGPDMYGYKWEDSNEEGGPVYEWFDISTVGTSSGLTGDDGSINIDLPFEFEFYGEPKTSILASSNGYLTFGGNGGAYSNTELMLVAPPNDLICPFWDDLSPLAGVNYYYYDQSNSRFIIQYTNWGFYSGTGTLTFQVQLYINGKISFVYETTATATATIGIENSIGDDGLQVTFNEPYAQDGMVIEFTTGPDWIDTDILSGVIPAGNSMDINFTFDAANFHDGDYSAVAYLTTNDPANPEIELPIILHVGNVATDDDVIPVRTTLFDNYPNPFNPTTNISYSLNVGSDVELVVYNVRGQKVKTLQLGYQQPGVYEEIWNGVDDNNQPVASGIYYYRMSSNEYQKTKKMILLK